LDTWQKQSFTPSQALIWNLFGKTHHRIMIC